MKIHIVQKGDTLWKIAKKYGVDFEELKNMNSQLSNPDLIMPGMKIKVPTGGIPVKNETKINYQPKKEAPTKMTKKEAPIQTEKKEAPTQMPKQEEAPVQKPKQEEAPAQMQKKQMPKMDHPYGMKKPKSKVDVEDTMPTEKKSKPYVPSMPNTKQPFYPTEMDVNAFNLNMPVMPQIQQEPQLPPKPANVFPQIMKPDNEEHYMENEDMTSPLEGKENDNMVIPYQQFPYGQQPYMSMQQPYQQPYTMQQPFTQMQQPYMPMQQPMTSYQNQTTMPYYGMQNQTMNYGNPHMGNPHAMGPDMMENDEMDNDEMYEEAQMNEPFVGGAPYGMPQVAPYGYQPQYGMVPPGCVPASPVMPGPGFSPIGYPMMPQYPQSVAQGMFNGNFEEYDENVENLMYPNNMPPNPAMPAQYQDCGCNQPTMPYYGYQMGPQYMPYGYPATPPPPMYDFSRMYAPPEFEESDETEED